MQAVSGHLQHKLHFEYMLSTICEAENTTAMGETTWSAPELWVFWHGLSWQNLHDVFACGPAAAKPQLNFCGNEQNLTL